jgi:hypothetical protein
MCDYSLQNVKSRAANAGEKLRTQHFKTGTIGFAAPEDTKTAVCVFPGTELAFATAVRCSGRGLFAWNPHARIVFRGVGSSSAEMLARRNREPPTLSCRTDEQSNLGRHAMAREQSQPPLQAAAGSSCWRMFWKLASSSSSAQNSEQYSLPEDERHA